MVEAAGIEPASASDPHSGKATCLVVVLTWTQGLPTTKSLKSVPQYI